MVDMRKRFEGDYLKAKSYEEGARLVLTIDRWEEHTLPGFETDVPEQKTVLYFKEVAPGLIVSQANGQALITLHGADDKGWIGKRIALLVTKTPKAMFFKLMDKEPAAVPAGAI